MAQTPLETAQCDGLFLAEKSDEMFCSRDGIVDWTYIENDRMRGNFTACPPLAKSPPAEQEEFKKRFGLSCDF